MPMKYSNYRQLIQFASRFRCRRNMKAEKIGIIGSGLIGRAWSMLFASVGYQVMLYDILPAQIETAMKELAKELEDLESRAALRGKLKAEEQFACIKTTTELKELVRDAMFIQECIPERIELKQSLYKELDEILHENTIVSSSTSTFMPSRFSAGLRHKENILVSHPLNPPYYIPLVEIVPAPWTSQQAIEKTRALMLEIGQKPVTLKREIEGFATNRIQYAILNEVWHLIEDEILTVDDVDTVMSHGLGLRYALLGPLGTAHLNAAGIADYFARFGREIYAVSETLSKETPRMYEVGETAAKISRECNDLVPQSQLPQRRIQRDRFLEKLCELKRNF